MWLEINWVGGTWGGNLRGIFRIFEGFWGRERGGMRGKLGEFLGFLTAKTQRIMNYLFVFFL
jgi:hypothetical protein